MAELFNSFYSLRDSTIGLEQWRSTQVRKRNGEGWQTHCTMSLPHMGTIIILIVPYKQSVLTSKLKRMICWCNHNWLSTFSQPINLMVSWKLSFSAELFLWSDVWLRWCGWWLCVLLPRQASHSPESHQTDPSHSAEDREGDRGEAKDDGGLHRAGERGRPSATNSSSSATGLDVFSSLKVGVKFVFRGSTMYNTTTDVISDNGVSGLHQ